ncbi:MAG TPA: ATP-binding protein [Myxococcales bacterium]|jgi:signal transduction histidine kinase/ActR/RegA family two-component response regulator/HAMP domain-containing protein
MPRRAFHWSFGQWLAAHVLAASCGLLLALGAYLFSPVPASLWELSSLVGLWFVALIGLLGGRALRRRVRALESAARALAIGDIAAVRTAAEALGPALAGPEGGPEPRRDELQRTARALARTADLMEKREAGLSASARFTTALASSLDAARIADEVLRPVAALSDADCGLVFVLDAKTSLLQRLAALVPDPEDPAAACAARVSAQALRGRTPLLVRALPEGGTPGEASSVLAVPLVMHDRPVGVLCLGRKGPFTEEAITFAQAAARPLGLSLQNAMLHRDVERLALELQEANERLQERNAQLEDRSAEVEDANAQLRLQAEELALQGRRKTEFLAAVAHELRNPLAVISSATRLLEEGAGSAEARERAPGVIRRQSSLLSRLVDDLLDAARVGRGQLTLERRPLDLVELARHAAEAAAPAMRQKNHHLDLDLPDEEVWIDADAVRMQQVLGNLLHNAAKYTDPGGHVKLQVRREDGEAVARVRDDGIGLSPEALAGVFELFMQVDRAGARAQGGLGIGLALVRDLVELHGGTAVAKSAGLGLGSEFELRLPAREPPGEVTRRTLLPVAPPRALTVLVLDDDEDMAESMAELMRGWGHRVQVFHQPRPAIEAALKGHPDVVITDIGLQGDLDGYAVARELRAGLPGAPHTLLIALTGYCQPSDRRRAQEAGFDRHFSKPVDFDALRAALEEEAPPEGPVVQAADGR